MTIAQGYLILAEDLIAQHFVENCQALIISPTKTDLWNGSTQTTSYLISGIGLTYTPAFTSNTSYYPTNISYFGSTLNISGTLNNSQKAYRMSFKIQYLSRKGIIEDIPANVATLFNNRQIPYELTWTIKRSTNSTSYYSDFSWFNLNAAAIFGSSNSWNTSVNTKYAHELAPNNHFKISDTMTLSNLGNNANAASATTAYNMTHTFTIPNGIILMGKPIPVYFWMQNSNMKHAATTDKACYINGWRYIYPSGATWTTFKNNSNYNVIYGNSTLTITDSKVKHNPPYFTANGYATNYTSTNYQPNIFYLKDSSGNVVSSTASIIENHQYRTY